MWFPSGWGLHARPVGPVDPLAGMIAAARAAGSTVGLMLVAILMLINDDQDPPRHSRQIMDALPSGSYLAITHPGRDFNPEAVETTMKMAVNWRISYSPRVRSEVEHFFGDWELIEPGVVPVMAWRPDTEPPVDPQLTVGVNPPSMRRLAPLTEALRGLATSAVRAAISWGSARRPDGLASGPLIRARVAASASSLMP